MPLTNALKQTLDEAWAFKFISDALTEINAYKAKRIRAQFEKNSGYYKEIAGIYHIVKLNAKKGNSLGREEKKSKKKTTDPEPEKILAVALTSNSRFYGSLNLNVLKKFRSENQREERDLLIIGRTGADMAKNYRGLKSAKEIFFEKDFPSLTETRDFMAKIAEYGQVLLYYPSFVNMMTQRIGVLDIAQSNEAEPLPSSVQPIEYIFEPELEQILSFFETQVRFILFIRAMLEAELSRAAARLLSMSSASQRAEKVIRLTQMILTKSVRSQKNAELLETFASIGRWEEDGNEGF